MTQWLIFFTVSKLHYSLEHVNLNFQQMEALAAESKKEMKAFSIISAYWNEKVFLQNGLFLSCMKGWRWKQCETLREIILPQPEVQSPSLPPQGGGCQPLTVSANAPPRNCSGSLSLWATAGWGRVRSGALNTTSPREFPIKDLRLGKGVFEGFLQSSYRPWTFLEPYK